MITAVFFDFGGVLTEGGKTGSIARTFARMYGNDTTVQLDNALLGELLQGRISTEAFFRDLNRRNPKAPPATKELFIHHADIFIKSEPVYALAAALRHCNVTTGILSNVFAMSVERLERERAYEGFAPLVLSCREKVAKPQEAIYRIAIERSGVNPENILFIDDQEKCLVPARALGIQTLLAQSPEQIVRDTKRLVREQNGITL